jgi:hypothetical protein
VKKKVPQLTLQEGFLEMYNQKAIEGKKRGTLLEYLHVSDLTKRYFVPDPILMDLTDKDWNGFFGWLRKDYKGGGFRGVAPRPEKPLSEKSIKNVHIVLCALYAGL